MAEFLTQLEMMMIVDVELSLLCALNVNLRSTCSLKKWVPCMVTEVVTFLCMHMNVLYS